MLTSSSHVGSRGDESESSEITRERCQVRYPWMHRSLTRQTISKVLVRHTTWRGMNTRGIICQADPRALYTAYARAQSFIRLALISCTTQRFSGHLTANDQHVHVIPRTTGYASIARWVARPGRRRGRALDVAESQSGSDWAARRLRTRISVHTRQQSSPLRLLGARESRSPAPQLLDCAREHE